MPPPRQGRKGGKVTSTTPQSLPAAPDGAKVAPEEKPPAEAVVAAPAVADQKEKDAAEEPKKSAWSDGALQIDKDAVQQVGRGNLVRGLKTMQTEQHPPVTSHAEAQEKLKEVIGKQKATRYNLKTLLRESMEATSKHDVAIIHPTDGHLLAVQLEKEGKGNKVLVVVPHYYEVSETANILREMKESRKEIPEVGELVGASVRGEKRFNLWVTSAESANLYLCTKESFSPFTHVLFPELMSITPLISFFLYAIRNHMQSATPESRVKIVIGTTVRYGAKLCEYFTGLEVKSLVNASNPTNFSYDESCALAEKTVMQLIGATSQRLPEKKAVQHCTGVAGEIVRSIIANATVSQRIHIFTGDCGAMKGVLSGMELKDTVVWTKNSLIECIPPSVSKQEKHWVYVLNNSEAPSATGYLPPHFVIELGTMGQQIQPNRDESFVGGRVNVWTTKEELEEHHSLVGPSGGYFQVYPDLSDERAATSVSYSVYEVETALLQSARTSIPNDEALLFKIPEDVMGHTIHNLSDNCLTVPSSELTFTGEMASRLPLGTDLVSFIIHACVMGLGEPAVVVASVCVLSMRRRLGQSEGDWKQWSEAVTASRMKYASKVVLESDILADTLVFLEWLRRWFKQDPSATTSFPEEIGCPLQRLQNIQKLVDHLGIQLSDYVFFNSITDEDDVTRVQDQLLSNAAIISLTYAVSSSRRALVVRDSGALKDRNATLSFVRTTKKLFLSNVPSSVAWESLSTVIAADIRTDKSDRGFEGSRFTCLNTEFYNAALLLLYPSIVYSAPESQPESESIIYFGISCNNHKKRFRVPVSHATLILNFRDKWNVGLGYLHALRMLPRPISRNKFFNVLREKDRFCNLDNFYAELQRELLQLIIELEVSEHHGGFDLHQSHYLCPHILFSGGGVEASDCVLAKEFDCSTAWPITVSRGTTPATLDKGAVSRDFPAAALQNDEEEEVETMEDLYFMHNPPIIDT